MHTISTHRAGAHPVVRVWINSIQVLGPAWSFVGPTRLAGFRRFYISRLPNYRPRSASLIEDAFRAGFHLVIHRAWPLPVGSSDRVTR